MVTTRMTTRINTLTTYTNGRISSGLRITPAGCPCPGPGQLTPRVATPTVVVSEPEGQYLCYGVVACVQPPLRMQRRA